MAGIIIALSLSIICILAIIIAAILERRRME